MSAISVDINEYLDICICMFMDAVRHQDEFVYNSRWDKFITSSISLGLKTVILPIYLKTNAETRTRYKMLAKTMRGEQGCYIHIKTSDGEEVASLPPSKTVNKSIIKKIFKKVKEVRFKTSMPITEDKLDKIIDFVVKKDRDDRENL